jgi:type VII secretion ATPase EccA
MVPAAREGLARDAWQRAAWALRGGDHAVPPPNESVKLAARTDLQRAVELDPGMADAWLGLHYLDVDRRTALRMMATNLPRFGAERRRTGIMLASRFEGGFTWTMRIDLIDQLYLAVTRDILHHEPPDYALADRYLGLITDVTLAPHVNYLRGVARWQVEDWAGAVPYFNRASNEQWVGPESRLLLAICLWRCGVPERAEALLVPLDSAPTSDGFLAAQAAYMLGRIHEDRNDLSQARNYYGRCYSWDPATHDVAARLSAVAPQPTTAVPGPAAPPPTAARQPDHTAGGGARPTAAGRGAALEAALTELDGLIGLNAVKRKVRALVTQVRVDQARATKGLPVVPASRHLVFAGPPGTGKTTVARLIGRIYAGLGILEGDTFVEASRSTLVGEYLGNTAMKTRAVLDSAMGGVLFIDEAYQLQIGGFTGGDAFGTEAIGELLSAMENDRDRLLVVAAGYRDDMNRFLSANEGLRSRFGTVIDFPSYQADELVAIFAKLVQDSGDVLTPAALTAVRDVFEDVCGSGAIDTLGNGRFARNVREKAVENHAMRHEHADIEALSAEELAVLTADDIQFARLTLTADAGSGTDRRPDAGPTA